MPGILIADAHPVIRRAVRCLLDAHELQVCGEAENGRAAIEKATELCPDIVLLDIFMPVLSGIEAAQEIRRILPSAKVVFLTMYEWAGFEEKTRSWADGVVCKSKAATQLVPILKRLEESANQRLNLKYPWQRFVMDAFASPPDALQAKINVAERTIAARLRDVTQPDSEERLALNEALRALQQLISERMAPQQKGKLYGAA